MFTVTSEGLGNGSSKIVEIPKGLENTRLRVRRPTIRSSSSPSKSSSSSINISVVGREFSEGAIVKCLETYDLVHDKNKKKRRRNRSCNLPVEKR